MTRRILFLTALVLLSASATPVPARAASGTPCTYTYDLVATPGLSTSPTSGTFTSNGETGKITCDGKVNGKQPTGPGTVGIDGRYGTKDGDTCQAGGEGDDTELISIPTSAGVEHITNKNTFTFAAFKAGSAFSGAFQGDRMSGTFSVQPIDGDCASKPVTKYRVALKGTLDG